MMHSSFAAGILKTIGEGVLYRTPLEDLGTTPPAVLDRLVPLKLASARLLPTVGLALVGMCLLTACDAPPAATVPGAFTPTTATTPGRP